MWKNILKKMAQGSFMVAVAFTWPQSGRAADCLVERGQDPLDVLSTSVRHNVWVILDTSGSMKGDFDNGPEKKFQVAESVIREILAEFVDGSGKPMVNWGFAWYWPDTTKNKGGSDDDNPGVEADQCKDEYQEEEWFENESNQCRGLEPAWFDPPDCGSPVDQVDAIQ